MPTYDADKETVDMAGRWDSDLGHPRGGRAVSKATTACKERCCQCSGKW